MKIKITSDREPWVNNAPQALGAVVECSDADGQIMIDAGLADPVVAFISARVAK